MEKQERDKRFNKIKKMHTEYLKSINEESVCENLNKRFKNLRNKMRKFIRAEFASNNSLKQIPNLSSIIFGLREDMKRYKINIYDFEEEINILNLYIIKKLEDILNTKYYGKCPSYGETILNCYLDIYITFTNLKVDKEIGINPAFLQNPLTGSNLELDVLFEGFKLAFEFQGEHHYTDNRVQEKDRFKLQKCFDINTTLIPVNIGQLSNERLGDLIVNSIKENLGIVEEINELTFDGFNEKEIYKVSISKFFKIVQRVYLSYELFPEVLEWLDDKAQSYIWSRQGDSPISVMTEAPRLRQMGEDISVREIYGRIPKIRKAIFKGVG